VAEGLHGRRSTAGAKGVAESPGTRRRADPAAVLDPGAVRVDEPSAGVARVPSTLEGAAPRREPND
jgi:hypothetical protein